MIIFRSLQVMTSYERYFSGERDQLALILGALAKIITSPPKEVRDFNRVVAVEAFYRYIVQPDLPGNLFLVATLKSILGEIIRLAEKHDYESLFKCLNIFLRKFIHDLGEVVGEIMEYVVGFFEKYFQRCREMETEAENNSSEQDKNLQLVKSTLNLLTCVMSYSDNSD